MLLPVARRVSPLFRPTLSLAIVAGLSSGVAYAQSAGGTAIVQPASPAPGVPVTNVVSPATATSVEPAPSADNSPPTRVSQTVYTPQLPSPADLTSAAAAQGLTVERIVQTSTQLIAFYRNAGGQPVTVAYQSLPPAGAATTTSTAPAPAPRVVVVSPPPAVVYETAPRVIYYERSPYYYPGIWYPPVSFSVGLGYRSFHGGGYHRGGFRHR